MKLFTKDINSKLFKQYPLGSNLEKQIAVAKIFNPYGDGRWFLLNSDPEDPDYIWAIVQMHGEVEMGSISRKELETLKVGRWKLPLERDLGFQPINALKLMEGLREGKFYKDGGWVEYAMGGTVKWQDAQIGDSARVIAENKTGLIMQAYGRKFHLKFVDGSEKTYDAKELEFFTDEEFEKGGEVKEFSVMIFHKIKTRDGSFIDAMRDRILLTGSLEKALSKTYSKMMPNDSYAMIIDRAKEVGVARINSDGTGKVTREGYGLNVGDIELEKEVEVEEVEPKKKKLFGLFAKGGEIVGYEVEYEKTVDGEKERDIKSFKTKEEAEKFAKENYSRVDNVYKGQYDYAKGGVTFSDKVSSIKSSLLKRKKVSPKVQKDYGKTYSPKEAEESAKRIAGAMTAKEKLKSRLKRK